MVELTMVYEPGQLTWVPNFVLDVSSSKLEELSLILRILFYWPGEVGPDPGPEFDVSDHIDSIDWEMLGLRLLGPQFPHFRKLNIAWEESPPDIVEAERIIRTEKLAALHERGFLHFPGAGRFDRDGY
jgi:hypothetical protein